MAGIASEATTTAGRTHSVTKSVSRPSLHPSPPFSEVAQRYLHGRHDYTSRTQSQVKACFRMWGEVIGDGPVRRFTGADAGRFLDTLRRMPAAHGKAGGRAITADNVIAEADIKEAGGTPEPRIVKKRLSRGTHPQCRGSGVTCNPLIY